MAVLVSVVAKAPDKTSDPPAGVKFDTEPAVRLAAVPVAFVAMKAVGVPRLGVISVRFVRSPDAVPENVGADIAGEVNVLFVKV